MEKKKPLPLPTHRSPLAGVWAGLGSVVPDPNIKLGSVVSRVETFGPSSFFHGDPSARKTCCS
ncbi:uncharacterized protein BO87DRAFT_377739 [Aspergillus neoniger CBS 115656]|uniref:Uncharacterized protein n=1 Tax=Aspergillus neoniger (strain CBS 115656) TaxID=1448310 RepID=A0A318YFI7_ASPNB|nr:hypothetical protein BO87DRAFT_377739 [Aspergillus neoniger CBS 115656]PYH33136.1 hypothetical protein BO87DRAFT_377739 [Aspergillus neoniger CBS 115656]